MNETDRWRIEATRLRRMVDGAADALMAHDAEGRFVDVNEYACQILGYSREELLQMHVADVEVNFASERVADQWSRLRPGQSLTIKGIHRRKDGSTFPVEVRVSLLNELLEQPQHRIFLAVVRDVSERIAAEDRLREAQNAAFEAREQATLENVTRLFHLNQAFIVTLESLAEQSPASTIELNTFLLRVTEEACLQTGAVAGHLFLLDDASHLLMTEAQTLTLRAMWGENADGDLWHQPLPIGDSFSWQRLLSTRIPLVVNFEREDFLLWPHSQQWHRERGHTRAAYVALKDGDFMGILALAFAEQVVDAEEIELAQTFAHQAALAVQLTRLALMAQHESARRAVLDERNRMAREIHDALAQSFTGIVAHLEAAQVVLSSDSQAKTLVEVACDLARDGLKETRRSLLALRPLRLEEGGLSEALRAMLRETSSVAPPVMLHIEGKIRLLSPSVEAHLLRIAQEALANARCHSMANRIDITLRFDSQSVELSVRDDGRGFDTDSPQRGGFGLVSMSERAAKMGGSWSIESRPGHGTQLDVVVPG